MSSIFRNSKSKIFYYQTYVWDSVKGKTVRIQKTLRTRDRTEGEKRQKEWDRKYQRLKRSIQKKHFVLDLQSQSYLEYRTRLYDQGRIAIRTLELDRRILELFRREMMSRYGNILVSELTDKHIDYLKLIIKIIFLR